MVSVLGPLFRTAGHLVRTQHGVTASAGQRRGDVEVRSYLRDQAGSRSLVFDLSITHDRFGSSSHVQQNGSLLHPQDLDGLMRVAAQRKTNAYRQTYADNQKISFLPAIMSTSNRMHGELLRLLFLQAHRETEAHFTAAGLPSQRNQSESFRFKRAAFYQGLKSKVGLAAARAAALRINLNVQGCSIVAAPMHAPSRTSLLLPLLLFTQSPSPPRSLVRDGQPSPHRPRLVVSRSTCPPISLPPHVNSFVLGPAEINTHTRLCAPHGSPVSPDTYAVDAYTLLENEMSAIGRATFSVVEPKAVHSQDFDLTHLLGISEMHLYSVKKHCGEWVPDHTVETALASYWTTPDTKIGRYEKRTLSAPVAVFARLVLVMLSDVIPVGKWSMSRLAFRRPGLCVDALSGTSTYGAGLTSLAGRIRLPAVVTRLSVRLRGR
jgi:hypothetical protein